MSVHRVTVQYATPDDTAAFDRRYVDEHVPMVLPLPGLGAFTWSKPQPLGGEGTPYLVAQLDFPDAETLQRALASPEMDAAGAHAQSLGVALTMFTGEVVAATG